MIDRFRILAIIAAFGGIAAIAMPVVPGFALVGFSAGIVVSLCTLGRR